MTTISCNSKCFYPLDNVSLCKLAVRQRYGLLDNVHDFIWGSEGSAKWPFTTTGGGRINTDSTRGGGTGVRDLFAKSQEPFDITLPVNVKLRVQGAGADLPDGIDFDTPIKWGFTPVESFFTHR